MRVVTRLGWGMWPRDAQVSRQVDVTSKALKSRGCWDDCWHGGDTVSGGPGGITAAFMRAGPDRENIISRPIYAVVTELEVRSTYKTGRVA